MTLPLENILIIDLSRMLNANEMNFLYNDFYWIMSWR